MNGFGRLNVRVQLCELSSFPIAKLHDRNSIGQTCNYAIASDQLWSIDLL